MNGVQAEGSLLELFISEGIRGVFRCRIPLVESDITPDEQVLLDAADDRLRAATMRRLGSGSDSGQLVEWIQALAACAYVRHEIRQRQEAEGEPGP